MVKAFHIASLNGVGCLTLALALSSAGAKARAQTMTLADAVADAYRSNPTLQLQRSQLRQLDEAYVQAYAAYRPTVSLSAQTGYTFQQQVSEFTGSIVGVNANTLTMGLSATQVLYNGGRTAAQVSTAEANILASREQLRQQEADTLASVIQAYAAVLRDTAILAAQRAAVDAYVAQANEIEARFKEGDVTRTDLEQAQSQLATGRSNVAAAQGNLEGSRAAFVAIVGENPGQLAPLPALKGLPPTIDLAFDAATSDNPALLQAILTEHASREQIREQRAQYMPTLTAQAFYGYEGTTVPYSSHTTYRDVSGTVTFNQPLFTGGLNASKVRQAQEQDVTSRLQVEVTRRNVIQAVAQNWNNLAAADRSLVADRDALSSARGSAHGMEVEYKAGLRSTLEVLNEEQRLQAAEVSVAQDEYNTYVAQSNLLDAIGRLETTDLATGVPLYDPVENFRRVPGDVIQTAPPTPAPAFADTSPGDSSLPQAPQTLASATRGRDLWMVVTKAPTFQVASDAHSIDCKDQICSTWELTRYKTAQPDGTLLLIDRAEYDCQNRLTRTLGETRYTADGVGHPVLSGASPWQAIKPDTAAEASSAFACALGHSPAPSLADRTLSLDGRTYPELSSADVERLIAAERTAEAPPILTSRMVVQIAAPPSCGEADTAIESLKRNHPALIAGLDVRIEPAIVGRRQVYRAVLSGFPDDQAARATCDKLRASGAACFVRRGP
jgi:outer membrane protein